MCIRHGGGDLVKQRPLRLGVLGGGLAGGAGIAARGSRGCRRERVLVARDR